MIILKGDALRLRMLDNILSILRDGVYPVVNPVHHPEIERHFEKLRAMQDLTSSIRLETHEYETRIVIVLDTRPKETSRAGLGLWDRPLNRR